MSTVKVKITEKAIANEVKPDSFFLMTQQEEQEDGSTREVLRRVPAQEVFDQILENVPEQEELPAAEDYAF